MLHLSLWNSRALGPEGVGVPCTLVSGHPYLVRLVLREVAGRKISLNALEAEVIRDEGRLEEHL